MMNAQYSPFAAILKGIKSIKRVSFCLVAVLALAGCGSLSIPLGQFSSTSDAVSGTSGLTKISVADPLPETLAYSDATVIGEVAARAILDSMSSSEIDWTNSATGSSGRWRQTELGSDNTDALECRAFDTTVTSVKGVHLYSGEACPNGQGGFVLRNIETGKAGNLLSARS